MRAKRIEATGTDNRRPISIYNRASLRSGDVFLAPMIRSLSSGVAFPDNTELSSLMFALIWLLESSLDSGSFLCPLSFKSESASRTILLVKYSVVAYLPSISSWISPSERSNEIVR